METHPVSQLPFLVLILALTGVTACGGDDAGGPASTEDVLARERAAHYYAGDQAARARAALAPLVSRSKAELDDLLAAAAVEVRDFQYEAAREFLDRAEKLDAQRPSIPYMRGRIAYNEVEPEKALEYFQRVSELAPGDLPTLLCRAQVLADLDRFEEASALLEQIFDAGIENGGSWYVSAVYQSITLSRVQGREEDLQRFSSLWQELEQQGYEAVTSAQLDRGTFGGVEPPPVEGTEITMPQGLPTFIAGESLIAADLQAGSVALWDVNGDRFVDLLHWGPEGFGVSLYDAGNWRAVSVTDQAAQDVAILDVENDDDLDFVITTAAGTQLWTCRGTYGEEAWEVLEGVLPGLPSAPRETIPVDADHDGDLDLALVGAFGGRLWRNDGLGREGGTYTDVSAEAGFPKDVELHYCVTEDYDIDQDVDFLLAGPGGTYLLSSLRSGAFEDVTEATFGSRPSFAARPYVADVDADARPDVLAPAEGAMAQLWRSTSEGTLQASTTEAAIPTAADIRGADLDADGSLDLIWNDADGGLAGILAFGLEEATPFAFPGATGVLHFDIGDVDHDCDLDVVLRSGAGLVLHKAEFDAPPATGLEWIGQKDNRRAVGAVCEIRAGGAYRRIYWRGRAELAGLAGNEYIDVVRVTWPNGVVQTEVDLEPCYLPIDTGSPFLQSSGLVGSCPFLYTWNGETFEFISDVIGITPLGLRMAPGMLVPPDHDEYVLVRGDQLVPDENDELVMQFTEELREVTYLDRIRLDVIDHPAGTRVYPNELFCFPPFPEPITHVVSESHAPSAAPGSDGRDWARELAEQDDIHAVPFENEADQFLGLAKPYWLELAFDPEVVAEAERLRLVMTGWFYWTDASVNMASARTPGVDFIPPILQVPGTEDSWVDSGPPIGFPAGKTKTMVVDVTEILRRDDPRLRLFSSLRLYWDRIELVTDNGVADLRTAQLEPIGAQLWDRGFSAPASDRQSDQPERFVWDQLTPTARWNQHPGLYTRFGETLPLLQAIDDQFVIMGSGDALRVRFDARELPPLAEGYVRDYFVFLDGWAKDRDPNTLEALEVEPLPFHGMSAYPYGEGEAFPDSPEHRAWREEWNTRQGFQRIVPMAPRAQREWLSSSE